MIGASVLIYTDADNTLWDTNSVFVSAQLAMLSSAESIGNRKATAEDRLDYLRKYDQAIAKRHHSGLRYPAALLIRALVLALDGLSPDVAATRVVSSGAILSAVEEGAISKYQIALSKTPPLLPGVVDGLEIAAEDDTPVYIITEGSVESTRERAAALSIDKYISAILSATKSQDLYLRLKERALPRRAVMIGDQPDRDIRPAHAAGLTTVLVRSRFRPDWHSDTDAALADAAVDTYDAGITWILGKSKGTARVG